MFLRRTSLSYLLVGFALVALVVTAAPWTASARSQYPLDPANNIFPPDDVYGSACTYHPLGRTCDRIMIRALNRARAVMGEPAYSLPTRFPALKPAEQLLVLSNQDRSLYGRMPIKGLNATLNSSARWGASHNADPAFVPVGGSNPAAASATWGAWLGTPLLAYYNWMYVDGQAYEGSGNLDCRSAGDSACWGHRHATLLRAGSSDNKVAMGAGRYQNAYGMSAWTELYEVFLPSAAVEYVPTVTGLSSYAGSRAGGVPVRINGYGLVHVRSVRFGSTPASFTVKSSRTIVATVPAGTPGTTHVRITTRGGVSSATAATAYTYS